MPTICLDYDGTYTTFPELLNLIVDYCKSKNYKVILATMRYESEKDAGLSEIENKGVTIYYTNRKAKIPYLNSLGIYPDLYVDDNPKWLLIDSN
jgi:hypothetical protein